MQALWGEYYFHPKKGKVFNHDFKGKLQPMFVNMILRNIWAVYEAAENRFGRVRRTESEAHVKSHRDRDKIRKIVDTLSLKMPHNSLKTKEPKLLTRAVMHAWLPISDAVLGTTLFPSLLSVS